MATNIAIFASGSGSNAENFIRYFAKEEEITIALIVTNKQDAYVLERAKKHHIPAVVLNKKEMADQDVVLEVLKKYEINFIVLAGYLLLIPHYLIEHFPDRIVNIHPALLPKYGGKGMYGNHVHQAVKAANESYSGITIHLVNEEYDKGKVLFQEKCPIKYDDTAEDIAEKVHELEYTFYPEVVRKYIESKIKS